MASPIFLDNKSILVSTPNGLKRLTVPFVVIVIVPIENLGEGDRVTVLLIGFSLRDKLQYYIKNKYYRYCLFRIVEQPK